MSRYAELAARLDAIADELDDLSLELLHEAVAEGATQRPEQDKVLTQARRAVAKAVQLLNGLG